tara:strand:- start:410 stop:661 length:252 start_codon:yes stop_codon:yes gene_type:complete
MNKDDVYYEFVVRSKKRDKLLKQLKRNKINLKITYPYPIYKMKPYKKFYDKKLEKTENFLKKYFLCQCIQESRKEKLKLFVII